MVGPTKTANVANMVGPTKTTNVTCKSNGSLLIGYPSQIEGCPMVLHIPPTSYRINKFLTMGIGDKMMFQIDIYLSYME